MQQQQEVSKSKAQKFSEFINQKPEFSREESLNTYYRNFDEVGDADDEKMLEFWKTTIFEYACQVENKFGVRADHLVQRFTMHDRVPCGLPAIMKELTHRQHMATREQILKGALFSTKESSSETLGGGKRAYMASVAKSVASGLYSRTFGYMFGTSDTQAS